MDAEEAKATELRATSQTGQERRKMYAEMIAEQTTLSLKEISELFLPLPETARTEAMRLTAIYATIMDPREFAEQWSTPDSLSAFVEKMNRNAELSNSRKSIDHSWTTSKSA